MSFNEEFFKLTQSVKIQLIEALRYGHASAKRGDDLETAIAAYTATRAIFSETEEPPQ